MSPKVSARLILLLGVTPGMLVCTMVLSAEGPKLAAIVQHWLDQTSEKGEQKQASPSPKMFKELTDSI
jgi:hypothetical protein